MLQKIKITGLFGQFDYEIELKSEGITILTGPNGYGKTTILKMIHAFATGNLPFFFRLAFSEIVLVYEKTEFSVSKRSSDLLVFQHGNAKPLELAKDAFHKAVQQHPRYQKIGENDWLDRATGIRSTLESLVERSPDDFSQILQAYKERIPDLPAKVYLIQEQRLIRRSSVRKAAARGFVQVSLVSGFDDGENTQGGFINTIEEYAKELSTHIKNTLAEASKVGQQLDSSFPERLFEEKGSIDKKEFNRRYDAVRQKQNALSQYGLSTIREEKHPSFKEVNATALRVYLGDTEKKLAVFDGILQRLELFSSMLNKKQFAAKGIEISPDFGFRFRIEDGTELPLTALSSGEQQEVILLYELLFQVGSNTLVLIDEPELSLHVAWQKEFLTDLSRIVALQGIMVMLATHSPDIIGAHWDWVVDLYEISR
uniref:Predicted ATP-binding protein involved in virulence n=1 Tax=Candidatus Kentrum sp. DK TaxID=2126562 RepID=A0A450RUL2_9GAMM|nr:MAG: Predicted ATP-binding protein involved in virulence [Candidatus Kentron sp. DK]